MDTEKVIFNCFYMLLCICVYWLHLKYEDKDKLDSKLQSFFILAPTFHFIVILNLSRFTIGVIVN